MDRWCAIVILAKKDIGNNMKYITIIMVLGCCEKFAAARLK